MATALLASNSLEPPVPGLMGRPDAPATNYGYPRASARAFPARGLGGVSNDGLAVLSSRVAGLRRFAGNAPANTASAPVVSPGEQASATRGAAFPALTVVGEVTDANPNLRYAPPPRSLQTGWSVTAQLACRPWKTPPALTTNAARAVEVADESYRVRRALFQNGHATSVELTETELTAPASTWSPPAPQPARRASSSGTRRATASRWVIGPLIPREGDQLRTQHQFLARENKVTDLRGTTRSPSGRR